jgi:hypothetical protein
VVWRRHGVVAALCSGAIIRRGTLRAERGTTASVLAALIARDRTCIRLTWL